jgi:hypothetical protein
MWKRRIFARVSFYPQPLQANAVCKLEKATIFYLHSSPLPVEAWWGATGWTTEELFDFREGQDIFSMHCLDRELFPGV